MSQTQLQSLPNPFWCQMELIYEAGEFSIFLTQTYRSTADLAAQVRIMYPLDFEKKKKKNFHP